MNGGSLHTRSFERIHFSVFCNGFTGPKSFRGFRETGPCYVNFTKHNKYDSTTVQQYNKLLTKSPSRSSKIVLAEILGRNNRQKLIVSRTCKFLFFFFVKHSCNNRYSLSKKVRCYWLYTNKNTCCHPLLYFSYHQLLKISRISPLRLLRPSSQRSRGWSKRSRPQREDWSIQTHKQGKFEIEPLSPRVWCLP